MKRTIFLALILGALLVSPQCDAADLKPRQSFQKFAEDPQNVKDFEDAVKWMKSLPVTDKRSWQFQANIHWTDATSNIDPLWNQCTHGEWKFTLWHRAYLYRFEKIIQTHLQKPDFRLPYWDYTDSTQTALPAAFRRVGSSLFESDRNSSFNDLVNPEQLPPEDVSTRAAFRTVKFLGNGDNGGFGGSRPTGFGNFKGALEGIPHDEVHGDVGGLMGGIDTSANDPIFWLHHCNIDRLWESWTQKRGITQPERNANEWLNASISLPDENGATVTKPASYYLKAADLGYSYDRLDTVPDAPSIPDPGVNANFGQQVLALKNSGNLNKIMAISSDEKLVGTEPETFQLKFKVNKPSALHLLEKRVVIPVNEKDVRIKMDLELEFDKSKKVGHTFNVYINTPDATFQTGAEAPGFVGPLAIFDHVHGSKSGTITKSYDVTETLNRLKANDDYDPKNLSVTVVPKGGIRGGVRVKPTGGAPITVKSVQLR